MGRPSPRTQGIDEEGLPFQKFGTQQLVKDPFSPTGVKQIDTGKQFKGFTTSGYTGTQTTVFSERFQAGITGAVPVELHDEAVQRQKEKLEEMGLPQLPDLGDLFGGGAIDKHGCECENCKDGIGQCSDKNPKCNAWDIGCELFGATDKHGCECQACKDGIGQCSDKNPKCNAWDIGCELFGATDKHGCECQACKDGIGQCSDKNPKCNAWDIGCEVTEGITNPIGSWWEKYGIWVYVILGVIGLGILLWLLRPLFGMIGAFKGGSP